MDYEQIRLNKFRKHIVFSILGFTYTDRLYWTGVLCGICVVLEEKIKERYLRFDDGWSYRLYWGRWKYRHELLKVL